MRFTRGTRFLLVAAVAGIASGAYLLGRESSGPAPQAGVPGASSTAANSIPHPPVVPGSAHGGPGDREGKVQVDPAQAFTHFRVGTKNVKSIYADGPLLWVGTSGGVVRYNTGTDEYKLFDARNGLLSNGIFYVGRVKGRVAVGTYGGGLSLYDAATQKWDNYNVPHGLGDAFVYGVLEASNGDLWIATWSGANRVRGGALDERSQWDLYTVANTRGGLPNDWVYAVAEGRNGDIWLATEGGLARYRQDQWSNWNHGKGLGAPYSKVKRDIAFKSDPARESVHHARQKEEMGLQNVDVAYNPNYIVALQVDRDGVVWAGTWGGGLARFDGKRWRNYTTADGLPGNHVFMLHHDAGGRLWIGTNNGLARFDNGKFHVLTAADGLFGNAVFSMLTPPDGTLWVGSYGGVAHIRRPPQP